jgi:hypothetical protein
VRALAYERFRDGERMMMSDDPGAAVTAFREAAAFAGNAGETVLRETLAVHSAAALVAAGQPRAAGSAFRSLMNGADDPPQIAMSAAWRAPCSSSDEC